MFAQIKTIVDLIRSGATDINAFRRKKDRREAILDMLRFYFILKDCVDEGEALVNEALPNPVEVISSMEPESALATVEQWDAVIRRQGSRLYQLREALFGQHHLAVINPELQERLGKVVGHKMDRAVTLHGIGAALFFKNLAPIGDTVQEKARYVSVMAGEEGDALHIGRIEEELSNLRESLDLYRAFIERMMSIEEVLQLSKQAREDTCYSNTP